MLIRFEDVTFAYTGRPILKDICLDITGPKFISIIGPNGVGKTTLLRCINNTLKPKKGTITIDGQDISGIEIKDMAKIAGFVAASSRETFPLSVADLVLMGRNPHSNWKTSKTDLLKVHEVLKMLEIDHLAMRLSTELSAGQKQKVMLARGLVQEPRLLLLDEPTSNLDVRHQMEVADILHRLAEEKGITVVMISHDLNIAAKYSDEMILMYDGNIHAVGTPEQVLVPENLEPVYKIKCSVENHNGRPLVILDDYVKVSDDDAH
ncbi:MAG: ABC transporter ATP-binding protein [archaeon]|nr:ABC transporter ATP-binding protein [archaeon]